MTTFAGKTMFISGGSRGIGLAIAKRVAAEGANIALLARTADPHPKLPGTDLSVYDCIPGSELSVDLWVDEPNPPGYQSSSIPTAGII